MSLLAHNVFNLGLNQVDMVIQTTQPPSQQKLCSVFFGNYRSSKKWFPKLFSLERLTLCLISLAAVFPQRPLIHELQKRERERDALTFNEISELAPLL